MSTFDPNAYNKNKSHGESNGVRAKKHLGQHFLKDENIAKKISETLTFSTYDQVLEIGPGTGVLTKYILREDKRLVVMDLDGESIIYLKHTFPLENTLAKNSKNFEVLEADFLKYDLAKIFDNKPFAITGNFPYNISTQIVFKALEWRDQVPEFTGMFQKEVAQRICEPAGSKAYGILSVLTQAFYHAEYLFTVPPQVFNPPPKVDSGVLRLTRKENYKQIGCEPNMLYKVVKAAFQQRRKTLRNSFKSFDLSDSLRAESIFNKRPEQLDVASFIALTQKITQDKNS